MVKAPQGLRHRTRKVMKKSVREKGAIPPLSKVLLQYKVGDKVHIVVNPAVHGGMPHRRYIGKTGTVVGFRGKALIVEVSVGSKVKKLFLLPEHVKPAFDVSERIKEVVQKLEELNKIRSSLRKQLLTALSVLK
uniref:Large ribosomal subunit protein eL21 n=1 Tax=Ignisphaera aggregans TaxID=334771 RepID=A0A7C2Z1N4_9CREN